jgi:glycosyltransferase involved in cell wall biosynthesis
VKKIKVLRIINRFNIGGPTYNATFLSAFMGPEYETLLVGGLPEEGESDSLFIVDKYGVKPMLINEMVRNPSISSDRKAYKRLKQIIEEFKPDIVHTHAAKAGALGRRAAISCNVPVVIHTFHGHIFYSYFGKVKTSIYKSIERRLAVKSDAIVAISEIQKYELSKVHRIADEKKITVVPLGFDLIPFRDKRISQRETERKKYNLENDEVAIAIVGRLAPIKNHLYFLEVIEAVLKQTNKKIRVFIVGNGTEKELIESKLKEIERSCPGVIEMTSWIEDIGTFNSAMDIICLTSKNEGTPVSLIEAQAAGIPVVTTDVGGVRDIIIEGETGHVVPLERQDLFIEKLLDLIENEKKREKMSQNGWNHVEQKFHYMTLVHNMKKLYSRLLAEKLKV